MQEKETEIEIELDPSKAEYTQTILYIALCETCGWESDQLEDKNEVIMEEWEHVRRYRIGIEHQTRLHCYLVTTRVDDITGTGIGD